MKLHEEQLLLVQDESVEYTASCGFWDSVHSPSSPSTNNTDSDTNNSGVQERLDDRGQFHLTKPTSSNPNRNRKRGRGRPRSGENPKRKRRKARVRIAIAPKLQVPKGIYSSINPRTGDVTDAEYQTRSSKLPRNPLNLSWISQAWCGQPGVRSHFTTK